MNIFQPTKDDFNFILANVGRDILINNITSRAVITNTNLTTDFNDKKLSTLTEIKQGDRIEYNGLYWLVISDVNGKRYDKFKGLIRACNHLIGFKINNQPVCIPVIAYGSTIGIKTHEYFPVAENKIILTIQKNEVTSQIKINDEFIKWGRRYEIDGIDLTQNGLIHLHCSFVSTSSETELICTEAGDIDYKPWYILIEGETELEPDNTYNYVAKVYDGNGNSHDYLSVIWSLNDGANSTIDQNGNLTVSAEDKNITIYAKLAGINIVGELLVETQSVEVFYSITGANEIIRGESQNYVANKLIGGELDNTAKFNFSIDYLGNSSSIATLTVISDTECSIKANSSVFYITLIAEDVDTGEIVKKENIRLKNLF